MILHPQLKKDCFVLGHFDLCLLLLINDSQYPWFILVPQRENISEIHQLTPDEQRIFIHESSLLAQAIESAFAADKINVAALGNVVPQLHIHHIVRYTSDIAWPKPVWGAFPSKPYTDDELSIVINHVQSHLPTLQATEQP